ncbi:PAS domain S-box protein [Paenibacillus rhizoplanae]
MIENTGVIVWAVHGDKRSVRFNKYAELMTGLKEKEVLGVSIDELPLEAGAAVLRNLLVRAAAQDYATNVELRLPDHSPGAHYFSLRTALIKGMDEQAEDILVLVGIDIDERKQNELKLQLSYEELESTYEELAATEVELQDQFNKLGGQRTAVPPRLGRLGCVHVGAGLGQRLLQALGPVVRGDGIYRGGDQLLRGRRS